MDRRLNNAAGQRFHNHSYLNFEKLKGDPDNIENHLVSYIKGFSKNVRDIFEFFEFENEIQRMPRGKYPLPRRLEVLRCRPTPEHGAERADGANLREPHPQKSLRNVVVFHPHAFLCSTPPLCPCYKKHAAFWNMKNAPNRPTQTGSENRVARNVE